MTLQQSLEAEKEILEAVLRASARGKISDRQYRRAWRATEARIAALSYIIDAEDEGLLGE